MADKTVDEILSDVEKTKKKGFKERIKLLEKIHHPDDTTLMKFHHHAEYVTKGRPGYETELPGCYNESYKVLDKAAPNDSDKIEDLDSLTQVLETYVDVFLQGVMSEKFKRAMEEAKSKNLSEEEIRKMKGDLFAQYHVDEKGRPGTNILDENYIKKLKGKKKIELVELLRGLAEQTKKQYSAYLTGKAFENLFSEEDRFDLADYMDKKLGERYVLKEHPLVRSVGQQIQEYMAHLSGEDLAQHKTHKKHYKRKPVEGTEEEAPRRRPATERGRTAEQRREAA